MGSFGVACGASKLPVDCGDKVGILLISKRKYSVLGAVDTACSLVSNSGAYGAFFALGLPLFGTYDDYGRIANYVEDENYHILKNFIEQHSYSFDEFMDNLYGGDAPLLNGMQVAGMFIHGDVYDEVIKINKGCTKSLGITNDVLGLMGFHKTDENTNDDRYKHMFRYKDSDIEIHSDNTWCHFIVKGKHVSCYNPLSVKKVAKKHFDVDIDISIFENISEYDVRFDSFQKQLVKLYSRPDDDPLKDIMFQIDSKDIYRYSGFNLGAEFDFDALREIYKDSILDGTIKKRLVEWVRFYNFLFSTNTLIMPTTLGEQFGNYQASKLLYDISAKIANDHIRIDEEDYEY